MNLGSRASRPADGMIQGGPGSQFACFVKNKKNVALGHIRSVSFFIDRGGAPQQPFRVHVYRASGATAEPDTDLLAQPLVVAASTGGQWFTIDLNPYYIQAPQEGFFVAMEWLANTDKPGADGETDDALMSGHILRPTFEFKESLTWSYTVGKGWSLLTLANGQGYYYNAMMKAEVEMVK